MTTNTNTALADAERLLRRDAESLRESSTPSRDRDDWTGEEEAKEDYDKHIAVADALAALSTAAVPHAQMTEEIDNILSDPDTRLSPGAERALSWLRTWTDAPLAIAAAPKAAPAQPAQHPDDAAVDALAMLMKAKLAKQRAKGYGGWDSAECKREWLSALLREHVIKGDPVDVANFCAFLSARGEVIAPSPAEALREAEMLFAKAPQPAVQQGEPLAWMDDGTLRAGSEATAYRVVTDATRRGMTASLAASFITPLYAHPAAPAAHGNAEDAARLDWLGNQFVTVRVPLRYGSKECFLGSPDDNDGESVPWDIRGAIDAARGAQGESNG